MRSAKCALCSGLFFVAGHVMATIRPLNTKVSNIVELRYDDYLCNYDDQQKKVDCHRTSLTNPEDIKTVTFDKEKGLEVICGYGEGENLIGVYELTEEEEAAQEAQSNNHKDEHVCSAWLNSSPQKESEKTEK